MGKIKSQLKWSIGHTSRKRVEQVNISVRKISSSSMRAMITMTQLLNLDTHKGTLVKSILRKSQERIFCRPLLHSLWQPNKQVSERLTSYERIIVSWIVQVVDFIKFDDKKTRVVKVHRWWTICACRSNQAPCRICNKSTVTPFVHNSSHYDTSIRFIRFEWIGALCAIALLLGRSSLIFSFEWLR